MTLPNLLAQLAAVRAALERYGIKNEQGYSELLVAKALEATRNRTGVEQGYDLQCKVRGKIEVKSRTLPSDGRLEARVQLSESKRNGFVWLAGVIFRPNFEVHGGYLLPHDAAWALASNSAHLRISLPAALAHPQVENITSELRAAAARF